MIAVIITLISAGLFLAASFTVNPVTVPVQIYWLIYKGFALVCFCIGAIAWSNQNRSK